MEAAAALQEKFVSHIIVEDNDKAFRWPFHNMRWSMFSLYSGVLLALIYLICPALCSPLAARAQACNGSPDLCNIKYSAVTSMFGAHDSPFVGPLPQQNQNLATSAQLDRGVRMLQAQTHRSPRNPDIVQLCHTDCRLEDAGLLRSWLSEIKDWMELKGHENEVITLLLTNPDGMPMQAFQDAFEQSGADSLCFIPGAGQALPLELDSWPTLGDIIGSGKRLIIFMGLWLSNPLFLLPNPILTPPQTPRQTHKPSPTSFPNSSTSSKPSSTSPTPTFPAAASTAPAEPHPTDACTSSTTSSIRRSSPESRSLIVFTRRRRIRRTAYRSRPGYVRGCMREHCRISSCWILSIRGIGTRGKEGGRWRRGGRFVSCWATLV